MIERAADKSYLQIIKGWTPIIEVHVVYEKAYIQKAISGFCQNNIRDKQGKDSLVRIRTNCYSWIVIVEEQNWLFTHVCVYMIAKIKNSG